MLMCLRIINVRWPDHITNDMILRRMKEEKNMLNMSNKQTNKIGQSLCELITSRLIMIGE